MRRKNWTLVHGLLMFACFVACALGARVQQKAESTAPIPILSPPEGNTTFIDGTTWCIAHPGASMFDLQSALDWACGLGGADCMPVQPGSACYQPDTILAHASYVFNSYYQQNGNSDVACNFGGTGIITKRDPSYGSCKYLASEPSNARPSLIQKRFAFQITGILLLLYLNACL